MLADRVSHFSESVIREMTRLANEHGAINLGQGMPDFETPQEIKDAACRAIQEGFNQYAITWGAPALREAIAKKGEIVQRHRPAIPNQHVTVCCGATECMMATMLALVESGRRGRRFFSPFTRTTAPMRSSPGPSRCGCSLQPPDWNFDPDELRKAFSNKTKAIIVNTPNNPTGQDLHPRRTDADRRAVPEIRCLTP